MEEFIEDVDEEALEEEEILKLHTILETHYSKISKFISIERSQNHLLIYSSNYHSNI
jgi:hypothetical protein